MDEKIKYIFFAFLGIIFYLIFLKKKLVEGVNLFSLIKVNNVEGNLPEGWNVNSMNKYHGYISLNNIDCTAGAPSFKHFNVENTSYNLNDIRHTCDTQLGGDPGCAGFTIKPAEIPQPSDRTDLIDYELYTSFWHDNECVYSPDTQTSIGNNKIKDLLNLQGNEILCPFNDWLTERCPNGFYKLCPDTLIPDTNQTECVYPSFRTGNFYTNGRPPSSCPVGLTLNSFETDCVCGQGKYFNGQECKLMPEGSGFGIDDTQSDENTIKYYEQCPPGFYSVINTINPNKLLFDVRVKRDYNIDGIISDTNFLDSYNDISIGNSRDNLINNLRSSDNLRYCSFCRPGYYQDLEGQDSCKRCPIGTYTDLSTIPNTCTRCPGNKTTYGLATNENDCVDCDNGRIAILENIEGSMQSLICRSNNEIY